MSFYPSTRYHASGATRTVLNPDQEHDEWRDKPWPPAVVPVKLPPCCEKLKEKFDKAYAAVLTKAEVAEVERDAAIAQRDGLALDLDILEKQALIKSAQVAKIADAAKAKAAKASKENTPAD